ncbi:hypothetical protein QRD90_02005 [Peribacillus frigoritolerans]|uniref:hypothetical protein n=1 Tax=Peribacillus frigoritolerans TaxID=450367 RepID=UPI0020794F66|nr:hypothetical protein [Peribacillus frigoritolerans]USK80780.1 hypothetical protein LHV56_02010 [Peribacillus frigoritolerans]WJE48051.1 hypothetical protein QRD90_02005 [Peribacillus frigoritolerans]
MKKGLGILSVFLFILTICLYAVTVYYGIEILPGLLTLAILILVPIAGIVVSLMAKNGVLKWIGLVGNGFVVLIAGIIPLAASFFWGSP